MSKLVIVNDYSSIFQKDDKGRNYLHKNIIITLVVQLRNLVGALIVPPYNPMNVFVKVELLRENNEKLKLHDFGIQHLAGSTCTINPKTSTATLTFTCRNALRNRQCRIVVFSALPDDRIESATTIPFLFLVSRVDKNTIPTNHQPRTDLTSGLAVAVAAAAASAQALNNDNTRVTIAYENFCSVRNWMDYTIVAIGGIEWINSPSIASPPNKATISLTNLLPQASTLMENIRSLFKQVCLQNLVDFFKTFPREMKEAMNSILLLSELILKTSQMLQKPDCFNHSYLVEHLIDKYLNNKMAFSYMESFFLRMPNLDMTTIVSDCFLWDEISALVAKSRVPKRDITSIAGPTSAVVYKVQKIEH